MVLMADLLEFMKTNSSRELVSAETHIGIIDVMSEPQHAPKALVAPQGDTDFLWVEAHERSYTAQANIRF
jgi:hypothetical protein